MTRSSRVVVSASIAYDYIMHFDGSFADHILHDKAHTISVSFLLDSFKRQQGGVAGNMVYNMAMLGVPTVLVGTAGQDFGPYRKKLERMGVDLSHVIVDEEDFTATAFMNADNVGNQIASFYPGSGADAQKIDVTEAAANASYGIISAGDPGAMVQHTEQIAAAGCKLIYDPAFQIVILSAEQIGRGIELADIVIGNDYEFGMMTNKTGLSVDDIAAQKPMTVITYGSRGSEIRANGESHMIPIATPRTFGDPTGGGDAYRAGLVAGLLIGADLPVAGRMAALTSTHAIEYHGPQEHVFTPESFVERFDEAFPDYAGAISATALRDLQQHQDIRNDVPSEV